MGQKSSIDRLPEDIRDQLHALLQDPRVTQLEATCRINEILNEEGASKQLSRSAVNRHAQRMEEVGEKLRCSREIAKTWIDRLGGEPQGEIGKLLNEMICALAFETTMAMSDGSAPVEPRVLRDLAITVEKMEKAASEYVKRDAQIREKAIRDVTNQIESEALVSGPMIAERLRTIIQEQYGV